MMKMRMTMQKLKMKRMIVITKREEATERRPPRLLGNLRDKRKAAASM